MASATTLASMLVLILVATVSGSRDATRKEVSATAAGIWPHEVPVEYSYRKSADGFVNLRITAALGIGSQGGDIAFNPPIDPEFRPEMNMTTDHSGLFFVAPVICDSIILLRLRIDPIDFSMRVGHFPRSAVSGIAGTLQFSISYTTAS